jgi:hypothetical protein
MDEKIVVERKQRMFSHRLDDWTELESSRVMRKSIPDTIKNDDQNEFD